VSTRDVTLTDLQRIEALDGDAEVAFVMDEEAFRAFYERTSRPLWAYLSRVTGDRTLAEDLMQDAYYRLLRARSPYDSEAHRRHALFRIATNLARDAHRRSRIRRVAAVADSEIPARDRGAAQVEQQTDLARAMRTLKARERAMLWLAYGEGSSHQEIARMMGLSAGSVKLLLFRARRRLAAVLTARPAPAGGGTPGGGA
jgi:RNA polymerase sigma-70 factor (ECF subfamily)